MICSICNTGEAEDLFHLIFVCPMYNAIRQHFHQMLELQDENICKLLSTSSAHHMKNIANFFYSIMKTRSFLMNE